VRQIHAFQHDSILFDARQVRKNTPQIVPKNQKPRKKAPNAVILPSGSTPGPVLLLLPHYGFACF
jgi:hypothetical protein